MLSKTKYASLCVLAMEIVYVLCIGYGMVLSGKAMDLHNSLFELIPGFVWGDLVRMIWGGIYMGVLALIGGWYIAWMHNTSIILSEK